MDSLNYSTAFVDDKFNDPCHGAVECTPPNKSHQGDVDITGGLCGPAMRTSAAAGNAPVAR